MRVTDRLVFERAARTAGDARARAEAAVERAASGLRVVHPGDDPAASGLVVLERARAARLDAFATSAARAADELAAADVALGEVASAVVRARELASQLGSAGYDAAQRTAAATEVRGLLAGAVSSLNVKVGARYVLGGRADAAPPFAASGAWSGDDAVREVEIAPGVRQAASVRAGVAVKGTAGGVDVLATLEALAVALESNDPAAARAALDPLADATEQLSSARAEAGAAMAVLDTAVAASRAARDDARAGVADLADADVLASATELQLSQRALEAALAAVSQGFQLTLLKKLG
ncbi:MAG TPA: flagellar biosynthesis protein FlgL [Anaeromyxobacteraceae bacterium]|nr:flagellar biosynthesis protein FlgL [Anaeromyxobacteraceae bacterium]